VQAASSKVQGSLISHQHRIAPAGSRHCFFPMHADVAVTYKQSIHHPPSTTHLRLHRRRGRQERCASEGKSVLSRGRGVHAMARSPLRMPKRAHVGQTELPSRAAECSHRHRHRRRCAVPGRRRGWEAGGRGFWAMRRRRQGWGLRLAASHSRNSSPIARLCRPSPSRCSPHSIRSLPSQCAASDTALGGALRTNAVRWLP
jgi:hypothetical protein